MSHASELSFFTDSMYSSFVYRDIITYFFIVSPMVSALGLEISPKQVQRGSEGCILWRHSRKRSRLVLPLLKREVHRQQECQRGLGRNHVAPYAGLLLQCRTSPSSFLRGLSAPGIPCSPLAAPSKEWLLASRHRQTSLTWSPILQTLCPPAPTLKSGVVQTRLSSIGMANT